MTSETNDQGRKEDEAAPDASAPPAVEPAPAIAPAPPAAPASANSRRPWRAVRVLRIAAFSLLALVAGSAFWALLYRLVDPPGTFVMLNRAMNGVEVKRAPVSLADISPHLVRAVIAGEDSKFCLHDGFDFEAIEDAAKDNKRGKKRRGASTLTQQTAKNAFLWNEGGWFRKGVETWFAALIDVFWPKRRVMEVYLNIAEWGDGHFGAEAAARARFGKSAKDLTKQEAALLAAVLPSPNKWRVDPPGPYVKRRAAVLRKRMDIVERDGLDACVLGGPD